MCCISISQWFENNFECAFLFPLTFIFTKNLCVWNLGKNGALKENNSAKWTRPIRSNLTQNWTLEAQPDPKSSSNWVHLKYIIDLYPNLNSFWGKPDPIWPIFWSQSLNLIWPDLTQNLGQLGWVSPKIGSDLVALKETEVVVHKVHIFWESHKILQNLHLTFDWHYIGHK